MSAGGARPALLGASGNSAPYEPYLKEIGAAEADDTLFASADNILFGNTTTNAAHFTAFSAIQATSLQNAGKDVNYALYWDAGHGADQDPEAFIGWIGQLTGCKG